MNSDRSTNSDSYRSLLLLNEIAKGEPLSQRDLSRKLNTALGLVNTYLKNLVSRGFVKIQAIPPRRYAYYLTPKGFTEKTRLTYHLLQEYTRLYREARRDFQVLFQGMKGLGLERILFAGFDEVTEIAYLSLQETDLEFVGLLDDDEAGQRFFKAVIQPLDAVDGYTFDAVVITTFTKKDVCLQELQLRGVSPEKLFTIDHVHQKKEAQGGGGAPDGG